MTLPDAGSERYRVSVAGGEVAVLLHLPDVVRRSPCVVACHGLGASKESDKYLMMAAALPRVGIALARFDFRGCGESTGVESDTTVATRIDDVASVIDRLARHPRLDGRVCLLGSSLGGFVALHVAATRGDGLPVVTWNAPADLMELREASDRPELGRAFFDEAATGRYVSAPASVRNHLVVQADADEVVPMHHGLALHARASDPRALVIIAGADHRLSELEHREEALKRSIEWFERLL